MFLVPVPPSFHVRNVGVGGASIGAIANGETPKDAAGYVIKPPTSIGCTLSGSLRPSYAGKTRDGENYRHRSRHHELLRVRSRGYERGGAAGGQSDRQRRRRTHHAERGRLQRQR